MIVRWLWTVVLGSTVCANGASAIQEPHVLREDRPVRVMPLGDSVTSGGESYASYRYPLWDSLRDGAVEFDFVGTQLTVRGGDGNGFPETAFYPLYYFGFDRNHEGYPGERSVFFLPFVMDRVQSLSPDVVMIHVGTNDVLKKGAGALAQVPKNLRRIISNIRAMRPVSAVLLAQIIPISPDGPSAPYAPLVPLVNEKIAEVALEMDRAQAPVLLVDQYSGFDRRYFQADGVHPNRAGEERLAHVWSQALADYLAHGATPPTGGVLCDASFELLELDDGESLERPVGLDWTFAFTPKTSQGLINPTADAYHGASGNGTPQGGDGCDVAYLMSVGGALQRAVLYQTLDEVCRSDRDYVLRVAVGRRLASDPEGAELFGGFRIELLAGNEVIGSTEDPFVPAAGTFHDAEVVVRRQELASRHEGQSLTVRFELTQPAARAATDFDHVRLIVQ